MNFKTKIDTILPDRFSKIIIITDFKSEVVSEEIYNILSQRLDRKNPRKYNCFKDGFSRSEIMDISHYPNFCILGVKNQHVNDNFILKSNIPGQLIYPADLIIVINNNVLMSVKNRFMGLLNNKVDLSSYTRQIYLRQRTTRISYKKRKITSF